MFGMLDYRAYKLAWLIFLPFRLIFWLASWALVAVAIAIGASIHLIVPVQIIIAYLIWEIAFLILLSIRLGVSVVTMKVFFWVIDVVPSKAESVSEAKDMVRYGPTTWLSKKFAGDIDNWTESDTEEFVSLLNWRARFFFHGADRFRERIRRFQEIRYTTGRNPGELTAIENQKLVGDLELSWFENAVASPRIFGAALRIVVIIGAITIYNKSLV